MSKIAPSLAHGSKIARSVSERGGGAALSTGPSAAESNSESNSSWDSSGFSVVELGGGGEHSGKREQ